MHTYKLPTILASFILIISSISLALLGAEIVAGWLGMDPKIELAEKYGVEYDTRSRLQVVLDCQKNNKNCFPSVPPNTFIANGLKLVDNVVLPLSGVANATVIGCNESGYYSTYESDKFGFRNPSASWLSTEQIDLAFVGDSYTVGDCVNDGDGFVDKLRGDYPRVVNLAYGGNGPLYELAAIKEYLSGRQVRFVFWVYFERNDLSDLERDKNVETLVNYLEPDFTQDLALNNDKINAALRSYVNNRINTKENGRAKVLPNLRRMLWKILNRNTKLIGAHNLNNVVNYDLSMFQKILESAKHNVEANGGRLVFVYLPEYERFNSHTQSAAWSASRIKGEVVDLVNSLEMDLIDIEPAFQAVEDPLDLFPFRMSGHYNERGNSIVAAEIQKFLSSHKN